MKMPPRRYALVLPIVFVLITMGLWLWAHEQYLVFTHVSETSQEHDSGWGVMWTDYTPVPLEIAGALNVPVATFAYPLYRSLHPERNTLELLLLLFGVAALWSYVGLVFDSRVNAKMVPRPLRGIVGLLGVLFGIFVLLASLPMHHVALIYKTAAVIWAVLICWHFSAFLNKPKTVMPLISLVLVILSVGAAAQQNGSRQHRKVSGLPRYMTDIPQDIPEQLKIANAPKTAREVDCFRSFTKDSTMIDVVRVCGIPDEHQGSGIYIFLYDMDDGSVVAIGTGDLKRLMYITHIQLNKSSSVLRKSIAGNK